jgi:hypothetical protein
MSVLAGLVCGAFGGQVVRDLGQADLDGGGYLAGSC